MSGFDDVTLSARLRDAIEKIAKNTVKEDGVTYRYGVVTGIDYSNESVDVQFPGSGISVPVKTLGLQPTSVGQVVQVSSFKGDHFVSGVSGASSTVGVGSAVLAAPLMSATGITDGVVGDWNAIGGAVAYEFQIATDAAFTQNVETFQTVTTQYIYPSTQYGTSYYVRARALDASNPPSSGPWSSPQGPVSPLSSVASDGSAPADSPDVTVTSGIGYLYAKWDPQTNADLVTYEVHVDTSSGFTPTAFTKVHETTGTFAFIRVDKNANPLDYNTVYYVRIFAKDEDGYAPNPGAQGLGTPDKVETGDAGQIGINNISDGDVPASSPNVGTVTGGVGFLYVTWDHVSNTDPVAYELHISTTNNFAPDANTLVGDTPSNFYFIRKQGPGALGAPLAHSTTYYIKIIAFDADGYALSYGVQGSGAILKAQTGDIEDAAITTTLIADLAVDTAKIADAAITNLKVADAAISSAKIQNLAVGSAQIADASITNAKIGALAVDTAEIASAAITSAKIEDLAVTQAKIALLAVDTAQIANAAISSAKIEDLAVTQAKIGLAQVDTAQIANAAITNAKIASLAVDTAEIANGAITNAKIGSLAVDTAEIANGAITNAKIANLAVDSAQIADGAIESAKIGTAAITSAKIGDLQVTSLKVGANAITGDKIDTGAVTVTKIGSSAVTSTKIDSAAVTEAKIASAAVTTAKIANATVTDAKIANLNVSKLLAGTIAGKEIILSNSATSIIRSSGFSSGSSGWRILGNGDAEFNNVVVRGLFEAKSGSSEVVIDPDGDGDHAGPSIVMRNSSGDGYEVFVSDVGGGFLNWSPLSGAQAPSSPAIQWGMRHYIGLNGSNSSPALSIGVSNTGLYRSTSLYGTGLQGLGVTVGSTNIAGFAVSGNEKRLYLGGENNDFIGIDNVDTTEVFRIMLNNAEEIKLTNTGILVPNVDARVFGTDPSVHVSSVGELHRNSSTLRFKADVTERNDLTTDGIRPLEYRNTRKGENGEREHSARVLGLGAEDVVAALGLTAGFYDESGQVEDFNDRAVLAALIADLQSLKGRIAALEP